MALNIPTLNTDFGVTLINAYAYTSGVYMDVSTGAGRATLNIHPTVNDYVKPPVKQMAIGFGDLLVPASEGVEEVRVKTLADFMEDPDFFTAWNTVGAALYAEWQKHPDLSSSTVV